MAHVKLKNMSVVYSKDPFDITEEGGSFVLYKDGNRVKEFPTKEKAMSAVTSQNASGEAYQVGKKDAAAGKKQTDNPYPPRTSNFNAWVQGFFDWNKAKQSGWNDGSKFGNSAAFQNGRSKAENDITKRTSR